MKYTIKTVYRDGVEVTKEITPILGLTPAQVFDLHLMSTDNTYEDTESVEMFDQDKNPLAAFNYPPLGRAA